MKSKVWLVLSSSQNLGEVTQHSKSSIGKEVGEILVLPYHITNLGQTTNPNLSFLNWNRLLISTFTTIFIRIKKKSSEAELCIHKRKIFSLLLIFCNTLIQWWKSIKVVSTHCTFSEYLWIFIGFIHFKALTIIYIITCLLSLTLYFLLFEHTHA